MHILPFCSIKEADENARALRSGFVFYSVWGTEDNGGPARLGLQRTRMLIARGVGCTCWRDLSATLAIGGRAVYCDSVGELNAIYQEIASRMARTLEDGSKLDKILAALHYSGFGRELAARKEAYSLMRLMPCKSLDQWHELQVLQAGYSYVSRYHCHRSAHEIAMLRWEYEKNVAKVMGTKAPRKPIAKARSSIRAAT